MLNKNIFNDQSIQAGKQFSGFHDLLPSVTGHSSDEMSIKLTYPFIVDWQLSESENVVNVEASQVQ